MANQISPVPVNSPQGSYVWQDWLNKLRQATNSALNGIFSGNSATSDPTVADIPAGYFALYKNTTSSTVKLWYNDNGTLKSVTLT
jgi:hypothetical protein